MWGSGACLPSMCLRPRAASAWAGRDAGHRACSSELTPHLYRASLLFPVLPFPDSKTKVSKHLRAGRGYRCTCLNPPNSGGVKDATSCWSGLHVRLQ